MIDQFFCGALVKESAFSMRTDTNDIHFVHLVEMYHPIFNIFIIDEVTFEIINFIQRCKFFHIFFHNRFF